MQISVIIPVFNTQPFLRDCIDSVINQTYKNIEVILVDDGSVDGSSKLCDELGELFDNIIVCHQENKGQAAARNVGTRIARGKYIGYVDGDDWVNHDMYNVLYENAIKENAEISCCGIVKYLDDSNKSYFNNNLDDYIVYNAHDAIKELLLNKRITSSPCDKLFLSEIVKKISMKEGMIFEDFEVMPQWLNCANKIVYTGSPFYYYRQSTLGTMRTVTKKRLDEAYASEMRVNFIRSNYPDLLELFKLKDLETKLNVLSCTSTAPDCEKERKEISKSIIKDLNFPLVCKLKFVSIIKLILLFLGLPIFDIIAKNKI